MKPVPEPPHEIVLAQPRERPLEPVLEVDVNRVEPEPSPEVVAPRPIVVGLKLQIGCIRKGSLPPSDEVEPVERFIELADG